SIFVMPPSIKELEIRLRKRGTESEEKIKYRLNKSAEELSLSKKFDVVIINDDFIVTKNKLIGIVNEFIKS
ncbi:MAG: guanylate kinase, partial [Bacteroidota bacterium]|nr:guanylate kinase [Bacteroidota bacterium]